MSGSDSTKNTDGYSRKLNPVANKRYQLRVKLQGVPASLSEVSAIAQYDVINPEECGRYLAVAGTHLRMNTDEPVKLSKVTDTEFVGDFYLDRILDEDYFGRGVCRWEISEARVLVHGPSHEDAVAVSGLPLGYIQTGQERVRYFWKGHYPKDEIESYIDIGRADLDAVPQEGLEEFFGITLSAKAVTP